jgi:hypothetical protein
MEMNWVADRDRQRSVVETTRDSEDIDLANSSANRSRGEYRHISDTLGSHNVREKLRPDYLILLHPMLESTRVDLFE